MILFFNTVWAACPTDVGYYFSGTQAIEIINCAGYSICPKGYYCTALEKYPCPEGHYGNEEGLQDEGCSGSCPEGFYCPEAT